MPIIIILIALIIVPIIFGIFRIGRRANRFRKLGDIRGMAIKDIVAKVGQPTSISSAANGGRIYQWMKISGRSGYHYAILSDGNGHAVGYTHQWVK